MGEALTRYHICLDVADRPGVLAAVAGVFARHDVSHRDRPAGPAAAAGGEATPTGHRHPRRARRRARRHRRELRGLDIVRSVASVLRVEGGA